MKTQKLNKLSDLELIKQYSQIMSLLKERGILKSRNMVGELGRHYAIETYNNNPDLANLTPVQGVKNINAMSKEGQRFCIKSTTKAMTGSFYGLNDPDSMEPEVQKFEYVVIVLLNEDYALEKVVELSWEQFLEFRKWDKARKVWYLSVTKKMLDAGRSVFVGGVT